MTTRPTSTFLIRKGRPDFHHFMIMQRMLIATVFRNKALVLWHVTVVAANHHLPCLWASADWTNICLLNMIIGIEVWIYLNVVIVTAGHWWLELIEDWGGVVALHVALERALRHISKLWRVISMGRLLLLLRRQPLIAQKVAIALTLYLILFIVFILPQMASPVCRGLV